MMLKKIGRLIAQVNNPPETTSLEEQRKFLSRVIFAVTLSVLTLFLIILVAGWAANWFGPEALYVLVPLYILLGIAWYLMEHCKWKFGIYLVPCLFFLLGTYGSVVSGVSTIFILFYVISFMLFGMLVSMKAMRIAIPAGLFVHYFLSGIFHGWTLDLVLPVIITSAGAFAGIGLLHWISISLLQKALAREHAYVVHQQQEIADRTQSERRLEALFAISETASTTASLEELYPAIHQIVRSLIPAENYFIALYDEENNRLNIPYHEDQYDEKVEFLSLDQGLTAYVFRTGQPLLASPETYYEMEKQGLVQNVGVPSIDWMGVPLKAANNQIIGVLAVQTYEEGIRYTEEDKEVLTFVSTQIAMAIQRKQAELRLIYLSTHDALTGLFNRAFFEAEMTRLQNSRMQPISIYMIDLDGLKNINDTRGHAAGDEMIRAATKILRESFRVEDIIARIGGDEFAILLPLTELKTAETALKRLETHLKEHNQANPALPVHLSIGCASCEEAQSLVETLNLADNRMYRAKARKKLDSLDSEPSP